MSLATEEVTVSLAVDCVGLEETVDDAAVELFLLAVGFEDSVFEELCFEEFCFEELAEELVFEESDFEEAFWDESAFSLAVFFLPT